MVTDDFVGIFYKKLVDHFDLKNITNLIIVSRERLTALAIYDILLADNLKNKEILSEWINWYVQSLEWKNLNRKYTTEDLSLKGMKSSWSVFKETLKKGIVPTSSSKHVCQKLEADENDIYKSLLSTFKSNSGKEQKMIKAFCSYGMGITASFLAFHRDQSDALAAIDSFMERHGGSSDLMRKIYIASSHFSCDESAFLRDWKKRYENIFNKNGCRCPLDESGKYSKLCKRFLKLVKKQNIMVYN